MKFYNFVRDAVGIIFKRLYKIKVFNKENVPKEGKIILCSNHISLLDPITVALAVDRQVFFMAKKELFKNKLFGAILKKLGAFPVNRKKSDLTAIKNSLKLLKKDNALGLFPEGTRVKNKDLDSVKPGVAMISLKSKAPIIPIYIDSKYKKFKDVKVYIGKPIYFKEYEGQKLNLEDYKKLSKSVMETIYMLDTIN
ncbi:MAG: 1-acyl-sn-glycerol-3-phosphate acyltransferase [Firmicutes bacterium]|nr:1-acyl-sn-glycerol-3-phosphate acyltransferase [Bacillota bacterium]